MKTFQDDIQTNFLPRYGAIAEIIIVNVGVYLVTALLAIVFTLSNLGGWFDAGFNWLKLPAHLPQLVYQPWTAFTYMFVHEPLAIFHILFNMLWLFWLGQIYKQYTGNASVWSTYLLGGLAGGLLYVAAFNVFPYLRNALHPLLYYSGSSAGVMAIIVATATLLPNFTLFLFLIGPVRLKWFALAFFVIQLVMTIGPNPAGAFAQVGGAVMGFLFITYRKKGVDFNAPLLWLQKTFSRRPKPKLKVTVNNRKAAPGASAAANTAFGAAPSQQEIDRILEKINAQGYDKLTKEEKQALYRASQQ